MDANSLSKERATDARCVSFEITDTSLILLTKPPLPQGRADRKIFTFGMQPLSGMIAVVHHKNKQHHSSLLD